MPKWLLSLCWCLRAPRRKSGDDKEDTSSTHGAPRGSPSSVLSKKGHLELGASVATGEGKNGASVKDGERVDSHALSRGRAFRFPTELIHRGQNCPSLHLNLEEPARNATDDSALRKSRCWPPGERKLVVNHDCCSP